MPATIAELLLFITLIFVFAQACLFCVLQQIRTFRVLAIVQFCLVFASFLLLIYSFVISDFTVELVANNSHILKPLMFKVAGAWSSHEGSMLMWILVLCAMNLFYSFFASSTKFHCLTLSLQATIILLFLLYIIFLSNPFHRIFPSPNTGLGLNPVLQDFGLLFHPPILYLGYVGFSIVYSLSIAVLFYPNEFKHYINLVTLFTSLSWSMLTLGIGLGSWWAYRELGWGGFWFWDPVENASLIPWLSATALLHASKASLTDKNFKIWTILLSILTFSFSCLGTFLVRSGSITSVHSFASDPSRGIAILCIVMLLALFGIVIFLTKKTDISSNEHHQQNAYYMILNNIILIFFTAVVVTGTVYPIILELLTDIKLVVGYPFYNSFLAPATICLLILCIAASKINIFKKYDSLTGKIVIIFSILVTLLIYSMLIKLIVISCLIIMLSVFLITDNLSIIINRAYVSYKIPNPAYIAHIAFAILALSITINSVNQQEIILSVKPKQIVEFQGYKLSAIAEQTMQVKNYLSHTIKFKILKNTNVIGFMHPEIRFYPVEKQKTTEVSILRKIFYDLYLTIDKPLDDTDQDDIIIKFSIQPMISFLWFGCLLLFVSGIMLMIKSVIKVMITNKNCTLL